MPGTGSDPPGRIEPPRTRTVARPATSSVTPSDGGARRGRARAVAAHGRGGDERRADRGRGRPRRPTARGRGGCRRRLRARAARRRAGRASRRRRASRRARRRRRRRRGRLAPLEARVPTCCSPAARTTSMLAGADARVDHEDVPPSGVRRSTLRPSSCWSEDVEVAGLCVRVDRDRDGPVGTMTCSSPTPSVRARQSAVVIGADVVRSTVEVADAELCRSAGASDASPAGRRGRRRRRREADVEPRERDDDARRSPRRAGDERRRRVATHDDRGRAAAAAHPEDDEPGDEDQTSRPRRPARASARARRTAIATPTSPSPIERPRLVATLGERLGGERLLLVLRRDDEDGGEVDEERRRRRAA